MLTRLAMSTLMLLLTPLRVWGPSRADGVDPGEAADPQPASSETKIRLVR